MGRGYGLGGIGAVISHADGGINDPGATRRVVHAFAVLYWALIGTVLFVSHIYLILFFVVMIASFVAPYSSNPALVLCYQIVEPVLAPFRKIIPPAGGFDFSMLFAGLVIMVVRMALQGIAASSGVPLGMLLGF